MKGKVKPLKPIIAECFKEWLRTASQKERQQFCDDMNAFATITASLNPIDARTKG
jgi:hypothetical protein